MVGDNRDCTSVNEWVKRLDCVNYCECFSFCGFIFDFVFVEAPADACDHVLVLVSWVCLRAHCSDALFAPVAVNGDGEIGVESARCQSRCA